MVLGVGAFCQGMMRLLKAGGAEPSAYLTRPYGHFGPSLEGPTYSFKSFADPVALVKSEKIDLVIPMSIEWIHRDWRDRLVESGVPFLCPTGDGLLIERSRDFARQLCSGANIPFPRSFLARNKDEAFNLVRSEKIPFVIKNPLCSPESPIHTIVCENVDDTAQWLERIDYGEGVFLQEYIGRAEAGHIALISGGEIYSLVTNQEYKRAYDGNMGIVAGAPLGGISEQDPGDKYGLAKQLLHPLLPWFRKSGYHGPIQVTAAHHQGGWKVLEYNVRLGVTNGLLLTGMLNNPFDVFLSCARDQRVRIDWTPGRAFGVSLTLAGFGYPYVRIEGPPLLVEIDGPLHSHLWWSEAERSTDGKLLATGHRIADINAWGDELEDAIEKAYKDISKLRCFGSYYRTDIGKTLWPPGRS